MHAKLLQSCPSLCNSVNCRPSGSFVHGILQARILQWHYWSCHFFLQGIFLTQGSNPRLSHLLHWQASSLPLVPPGKPLSHLWCAQPCSTLCSLIDCSLLGSSVHEILQASILEWVVMPSFKGSSQPRNRTWVSCIASRFFTNWATRKALKPPTLW